MSIRLLRSPGGTLLLPDRGTLLAGRADGGALVVLPPRPVWERGELDREELVQWGLLVAAAGQGMLEALPQLAGGCLNYWEAGNWALNDAAEPAGPKEAPPYRRVHLHLLGRSRTATRPEWQWGESPDFPRFADRVRWSAGLERLTGEECRAVISVTRRVLVERYGVPASAVETGQPCPACGYPALAAG